jgi:hypothetical protein
MFSIALRVFKSTRRPLVILMRYLNMIPPGLKTSSTATISLYKPPWRAELRVIRPQILDSFAIDLVFYL